MLRRSLLVLLMAAPAGLLTHAQEKTQQRPEPTTKEELKPLANTEADPDTEKAFQAYLGEKAQRYKSPLYVSRSEKPVNDGSEPWQKYMTIQWQKTVKEAQDKAASEHKLLYVFLLRDTDLNARRC